MLEQTETFQNYLNQANKRRPQNLQNIEAILHEAQVTMLAAVAIYDAMEKQLKPEDYTRVVKKMFPEEVSMYMVLWSEAFGPSFQDDVLRTAGYKL